MKQLKSVENFADVKCENCVSYNQGKCYSELPAISTEPDNKCGEGGWLLKGQTVNYRGCCLELLPYGLVTEVEELLCKNCGYYDSSGGECHYQKLNVYKSAPNDWCNNGVWSYREKNHEVILASVYHLYEILIADKDTEIRNSKSLRLVKSVEVFSDAICENCISYNQCRCCLTLPVVPVAADNKCSEGQWLNKGKIFNLHGISNALVSHTLVKAVTDLRCGKCVFYNPTKEECHNHRLNISKSGPDDWCGNGKWLYQKTEDILWCSTLWGLYEELIETNDTQEK